MEPVGSSSSTFCQKTIQQTENNNVNVCHSQVAFLWPVSERLRERVVVDFELRDLVVLIRRDGDENGFGEHEDAVFTVVVCVLAVLDHVYTRLVLLH